MLFEYKSSIDVLWAALWRRDKWVTRISETQVWRANTAHNLNTYYICIRKKYMHQYQTWLFVTSAQWNEETLYDTLKHLSFTVHTHVMFEKYTNTSVSYPFLPLRLPQMIGHGTFNMVSCPVETCVNADFMNTDHRFWCKPFPPLSTFFNICRSQGSNFISLILRNENVYCHWDLYHYLL